MEFLLSIWRPLKPARAEFWYQPRFRPSALRPGAAINVFEAKVPFVRIAEVGAARSERRFSTKNN